VYGICEFLISIRRVFTIQNRF